MPEENKRLREHRIPVSVSEEQFKILKAHSKETGIPMSFTIYKAAMKWLESENFFSKNKSQKG